MEKNAKYYLLDKRDESAYCEVKDKYFDKYEVDLESVKFNVKKASECKLFWKSFYDDKYNRFMQNEIKNIKGKDFPLYDGFLFEEKVSTTKYSWFSCEPNQVNVCLNFVPIVVEKNNGEYCDLVTGMKITRNKRDIGESDSIYGFIGSECCKQDVVKVLKYLEDNELLNDYSHAMNDLRIKQISDYIDELSFKSLEEARLLEENEKADDYLKSFKRRYRK